MFELTERTKGLFDGVESTGDMLNRLAAYIESIQKLYDAGIVSVANAEDDNVTLLSPVEEPALGWVFEEIEGYPDDHRLVWQATESEEALRERLGDLNVHIENRNDGVCDYPHRSSLKGDGFVGEISFFVRPGEVDENGEVEGYVAAFDPAVVEQLGTMLQTLVGPVFESLRVYALVAEGPYEPTEGRYIQEPGVGDVEFVYFFTAFTKWYGDDGEEAAQGGEGNVIDYLAISIEGHRDPGVPWIGDHDQIITARE